MSTVIRDKTLERERERERERETGQIRPETKKKTHKGSKEG
jgi:hypothetical protein